MFDDHAQLSVAELVFFTPTLCLSLYICFRHGFGKQLGWVYLSILSLIRIIGASCQVAAEAEQNPSEGLYTAAIICSIIGLAPLLGALLGTLKRVHEGMHVLKVFSPIVFKILHIVLMVAVILSIVGGTKGNDNNTTGSSSPGAGYFKGGAILYLLAFLALTTCTGITLTERANLLNVDTYLVFGAAITTPFLVVRVVYTVTSVFANSTLFNTLHPNIYVQAFMQLSMEAMVVVIFLVTGFLTPAVFRPETIGEKDMSRRWPMNGQGNGGSTGAPIQYRYHSRSLNAGNDRVKLVDQAATERNTSNAHSAV
ncbi:hypothetical protein B0A49_11324 [Cryomyces minteri]|uniref:DUF7702 domain-containing protein n=1 Tax=Cryomyces minteri TaxID=331657 RepID=A0A4U0WFZ9_9PEZI|nr:hypothetical protein B0A49_11324 [Cryomyces minteri]